MKTQEKVTHTPGPWQAMPGPRIVGPDGKDILAGTKWASHPDVVLAALAPELLTMLQRALRQWDSDGNDNWPDEARELIAKALGS